MKEVIRKLKFTTAGIVINAPKDLEAEFMNLGFATSLGPKAKSRNTLVFVNNHKEFNDFISAQLKEIEPDSLLWFAYPKGSSKVRTDINRDILREAGSAYGITTVAAISINDTWSGLRFRPTDKVKK